MTRARPGKGEGRGEPIEDPQVLREVLQLLFETETEFQIKVEGTSTLPYAAWIQSLQFDTGRCVLRLVRPLPHEMLAGAVFRMTFAAGEQRYEGLAGLTGREGYLQYGFHLPPHLVLSDRRRHKRYPFRPRENAYVIAQDAGVPGLGVAGPLVNLGQGGAAMRVDRALRMDDGMRVPVGSALFERGKGFPRLRIQDLPHLRLLEGRAVAAHATGRGTELVLGLAFTALAEADAAALGESLALREQMHRGGAGPRGEGEAVPARAFQPREAGAEDAPPGGGAVPQAPADVPVLVKLQRRTARLVLAMEPGPARQGLVALLQRQGYRRLEVVERLDQLGDPARHRPSPALALVDLALARSGDVEPLAAVRLIEGRLAAIGGLPAAVLCDEVDPTLQLVQGPRTRILPYPAEGEDGWVANLDPWLP